MILIFSILGLLIIAAIALIISMENEHQEALRFEELSLNSQKHYGISHTSNAAYRAEQEHKNKKMREILENIGKSVDKP